MKRVYLHKITKVEVHNAHFEGQWGCVIEKSHHCNAYDSRVIL